MLFLKCLLLTLLLQYVCAWRRWRTLSVADFNSSRAHSALIDENLFDEIAVMGGVQRQNLPFDLPKTYHVSVVRNKIYIERGFAMHSRWYKGQIRLEEVLTPLYEALEHLTRARLLVPDCTFGLDLADTGIKTDHFAVLPRLVLFSVAKPSVAPSYAPLHILVPGPEYIRARAHVDTLAHAQWLTEHGARLRGSRRRVPFEKKDRRMFWRGGLHGRPVFRGFERIMSARSLLLAEAHKHPELYNVEVTHVPYDLQEFAHHHLLNNSTRPLANATQHEDVGFDDFQRYLGVFDLDGYGYSGSLIHHLMRSSVVLKMAPDWLDILTARAELLRPGADYLSFQRNISDVQKRANNVLHFTKESYEAMVSSAQQRVAKFYAWDRLQHYWVEALVRYATLQRFETSDRSDVEDAFVPCHCLWSRPACEARGAYLYKYCQWYEAQHQCGTAFVDMRYLTSERAGDENRPHLVFADVPPLAEPDDLADRDVNRTYGVMPADTESAAWLLPLRADERERRRGGWYADATATDNATLTSPVHSSEAMKVLREEFSGVLVWFVVSGGVDVEAQSRVPDRVVCAVESASAYNPTSPVLVVALPSIVTEWRRDERLAALRNVRVVPFNARLLFADMPLRHLTEGKCDTSKEVLPRHDHYARFDCLPYAEHVLADAVRLALLYRFGGVYLDTDAFVVRSLNEASLLAAPTVAQQKWKDRWRLNNAVMVFPSANDSFITHAMHWALDQRQANFTLWGALGPRMLSGAAAALGDERVWHGEQWRNPNGVMEGAQLRVVSWRWFYSFLYADVEKLVMSGEHHWTVPRDAFVVHLWASAWRERNALGGSERSLMARFMSEVCPKLCDWKKNNNINIY